MVQLQNRVRVCLEPWLLDNYHSPLHNLDLRVTSVAMKSVKPHMSLSVERKNLKCSVAIKVTL